MGPSGVPPVQCRIAFDAVANRDVGELFDEMPLDRFCKGFLRGFGSHRQRAIGVVGFHGKCVSSPDIPFSCL